MGKKVAIMALSLAGLLAFDVGRSLNRYNHEQSQIDRDSFEIQQYEPVNFIEYYKQQWIDMGMRESLKTAYRTDRQAKIIRERIGKLDASNADKIPQLERLATNKQRDGTGLKRTSIEALGHIGTEESKSFLYSLANNTGTTSDEDDHLVPILNALQKLDQNLASDAARRAISTRYRYPSDSQLMKQLFGFVSAEEPLIDVVRKNERTRLPDFIVAHRKEGFLGKYRHQLLTILYDSIVNTGYAGMNYFSCNNPVYTYRTVQAMYALDPDATKADLYIPVNETRGCSVIPGIKKDLETGGFFRD